ncbi:MAG TPA: preprotein translocase subunit SecG [Spirochaetota bacterium]|nr:preprotein translocase subunit SecG [Spirochaetota bacterium]HNT11771.1 preprotein translocase subunit SecG [Spirochaetota bacterium]HNV47109.1 preprotein translocase subunit SecG [Spirochaetota bacterium]HOS40524.1 preprotein translocase subunit SecG [Spirochaetota bacterium]HPU88738.1 preprotein translocase subunit SecG [Spirochaetota bacterium]
MSILISVLTVVFVILSGLLIVIILLQSDKSSGMGILGGSSQSTFGSSTADIITKITTAMVALFMIGSLGLSILESIRDRAIERDLVGDKKPSGVIGPGVQDGKKEPVDAKKDATAPKTAPAQPVQQAPAK